MSADSTVKPYFVRVTCTRTVRESSIHYVREFGDEDAALKYADWVSDGRGEVLSVAVYSLIKVINRPTPKGE